MLLVLLALGAGAAGAIVGSGQDDEEETAANVPTPGRGTPEERISFLAKIIPPPAREQAGGGSAFPRRVAAVAKRMSTERKVAQLFVFGFRGRTRRRRSSGGSAASTSAVSCWPPRTTWTRGS